MSEMQRHRLGSLQAFAGLPGAAAFSCSLIAWSCAGTGARPEPLPAQLKGDQVHFENDLVELDWTRADDPEQLGVRIFEHILIQLAPGASIDIAELVIYRDLDGDQQQGEGELLAAQELGLWRGWVEIFRLRVPEDASVVTHFSKGERRTKIRLQR